jgi:hypothetical protein
LHFGNHVLNSSELVVNSEVSALVHVLVDVEEGSL